MRRIALALVACLWTVPSGLARAAEPEPDPDPSAVAPSDEPTQPPTPEKPKKPKKPKAKKPKAKASATSDLPLVHEKLSRRWMFLMPIDLELAAGWASGWQTRAVDGAVIDASLAVEPQLRWRRGRFRLRAPLELSHGATLGFHLPETHAGAAVVVSGKPEADLELRAAARLARTWRLGWDDFYQPVQEPGAAGELYPSDRYGTTTWLAEAGLSWDVAKEVDVGVSFELEQKSWDHDPSFDAVLAPTHLTPNDRTRLGVRARLRTEPVKNRLHANLALVVDSYDYQFAFARDAGTGLTHAGLGGEPANPLQSFLQVQVLPELSLFVPDLKTRFSLDLRAVMNVDTFAGYYSWSAYGGTVAVRVRPVRDVKLELDYDLDFRRYTHDGYQPGPSHAPLDDGGDVRTRTRHELGLAVTWSLFEGTVEPFIDARWHRLDDTMPDYVPLVNPPGTPYAVDFDEAPWWTARLGVRVSL